jgi:hypothetical protein
MQDDPLIPRRKTRGTARRQCRALAHGGAMDQPPMRMFTTRVPAPGAIDSTSRLT